MSENDFLLVKKSRSNSSVLSEGSVPALLLNLEQENVKPQTCGTVNILMTLLMSVIGSGILSIPYIFMKLPLAVALSLIAVVAFTMAFTAHLLIKIGFVQSLSATNYQALSGGGAFGQIVTVVTIFAIFGGCVGCINIIQDISPFLIQFCTSIDDRKELTMEQESKVLTILLFLGIVLPLCLIKRISSLKFSSYLGFGFSLYLFGAILYRFFHTSTRDSVVIMYDYSFWDWVFNVAQAFSIFTFAFVMHLNVLPLFIELDKQNLTKDLINPTSSYKTMMFIVYSVSSICLIFYSVFGFSAAYIYGNQTAGNILINLRTDPIMEIPQFAVLFTVLFSFPLLFHPMQTLVGSLRPQWVYSVFSNNDTRIRTIETFSLLCLQILVAFCFPSLEKIFAITGATCGVLICYTFPCLFYIKIFKDSWSIVVVSLVIIISGLLGFITTIKVLFIS